MGRDGSKGDAGTAYSAVSGGAQGDGHAQDRKVERAATAQLQVDALPACGGRQDDLAEYLIRGFRVGVYAIVAKERLYRYYTLAAHTNQAHRRAKADQDGGGIRRRDGPAARAAGRNQADSAIFLHAVADGVPPELGLIVVVAAGIQEQVAADGTGVAQLRRRNGIGSGSKSAIMLLQRRVHRYGRDGAASDQHGRIAFSSEHVRGLFETTGGQVAKGWKAQHQDTLPF